MIQYIIAGAIGFVVAKLLEEDEAPKYADGGSILLAPNGKRSNLTPEQYKLVRTKAFKDWFGDWENDPANASKVVDSNGEPMVCYHGTTFDFNIFEKTIFGKFGKGMYFTSYIDFAKKYAKNYDESRIIPVFLKSINLVKTEKSFLDQIKNIPKKYDGIWSSLVWTNDYDYNEISEDEIIVYSPEQIKLADGTNTTFDGNNPDIRYAGGGNIKKVKFNIESREGEEDRTTISIKGIGEVVLVETYPEYEFIDDIDEDTLEELGVEEGDMIGKIEHLIIEDKYKGQGYAKLLMNKAIEVAKEKDLMPLYLNASPMGSKGLNINDLTAFYESFGFEVFLEQGNNNLMILK